jgi:predicted O-linked N-acetylglucosamine transferase (SPINDLY family)
MKPVWALINRHNRERFELLLYSNGKLQQLPSGYRPLSSDQWRWTAGRSHVEMARMIADDRLDLLIDLNGFSRLPRLEVFALRPAPVQAAWFNMFATSGSNAFDFLIGDETVIGVPADQNGEPKFIADPTTEAIWQGVPVVAIHGDRWTSRVSSSLLSNAGLADFIASDSEGYVRLAVSAAIDPSARQRLAELRLGLRDQLRHSRVCDADDFTRSIEAAYTAILSASGLSANSPQIS